MSPLSEVSEVSAPDEEARCVGVYWVAVKELTLSYHNGHIYMVNNRVSPI